MRHGLDGKLVECVRYLPTARELDSLTEATNEVWAIIVQKRRLTHMSSYVGWNFVTVANKQNTKGFQPGESIPV